MQLPWQNLLSIDTMRRLWYHKTSFRRKLVQEKLAMDTIPSSILLITVLVLIAMTGGLGFWLYRYVTGESQKSEKQKRPSLPRRMSMIEIQEAGEMDEQELLSVYRMAGGELAIFAQGQRYQNLREIRDPRVGKETVAALKHILAFAKEWLPALRQEPSAPPPAAPITPHPAVPITPAPPVKPSVDEEAFLAQMRQTDLFPQSPSSRGLVIRPPKRKTSFQSSAPLVTPADQINNLVQQRMQERPDLSQTYGSVGITTAADGGLSFCVGLHSYAQVDSIPDPKVRDIIQDAIHEWKES